MKKRSNLTDDSFTSDLVARLTASRKYRNLSIPQQTIENLVGKATLTHSDPKEVENIVLQKLPEKYILLSLPTVSLTGRRSMLDQDRRLVEAACDGQGWQVSELVFASEIVFCIRKEA